MHADGAGVPIELEHRAQFYIGPITIAGGGCSRFPVGGYVSGRVGNGPVDVAGKLVDLVNRLIGRRFRTGSQQQGQMPAGRHAHRPDFLRIISPFFGLAADHAHRPLTVLPGTLVNGKALRTRGAVHKIHALHAKGGELLAPVFDQVHVAAILVGAAGNQDHAGPVGIGGFVEPFQIRHAIRIGIEILGLGDIGHGSDLMSLDIRHLAGGPDGLALPRKQA